MPRKKLTDKELREVVEADSVLGSNSFWDTVNVAKKVHLPKAHLTQPGVVTEISTAMADLDEPGRVSAFRQVMTGVIDGSFSQYALIVFAHHAQTTIKKDGTVLLDEKTGQPRLFNRVPEAKRFLAVLDAIVEEMPEDSPVRAQKARYSEAVKAVRGDEESARVDENQLAQMIVAQDEAGDPFWVDSREFLKRDEADIVVVGSRLQLADLVRTGLLSVEKTKGGGYRVFVARKADMPAAIDRLEDVGFGNGAKLLRERTQQRKQNKSGFAGLAKLSASSKVVVPSATEEETDVESPDANDEA